VFTVGEVVKSALAHDAAASVCAARLPPAAYRLRGCAL